MSESIHFKDYRASFGMLSSDFRQLTDYIEPSDPNLSVYSHRLYELLLRAATDFESLCKQALIASEYPKQPRNIHDYRSLEPTLHLEEVEVGVLLWRPATAYVQPYAAWSTAPLPWYQAYNRVKHDRVTFFAEASLHNVRLALSGLFALLQRLDVFGDPDEEHNANGVVEHFYQDILFSLRLSEAR